LDPEGSTPEVELPIPTQHPTAGRSLRDLVRHEGSEHEMWLPFKNKTDFELAQWFIEAKVPKNYINKYFRLELGQRIVLSNLYIDCLILLISWNQVWG